MSDTSNPIFGKAWARTIKAQRGVITRQKKEARAARRFATYGKASPIYTIQLIHYQQGGKCANLECRAIVPLRGHGRAVDRDPLTGAPLAVLCKSCSMILANARRKRNRLTGLIDYLDKLASDDIVRQRAAKARARALQRDRDEKGAL